MLCLISIVFIAELIILYNVLLFLIRTDRQVCTITAQIDKNRTKLKWRMLKLVEISEGLNEIFPVMSKKLQKTGRNIAIRLLNHTFQGSILLFFKPKYKKMLIGLKTGIGVAKKLLKV